MILAVDVGNTNIVLGCIEGEKIGRVYRVGTDPNRTSDEYAISLKQILELDGVNPRELEGAVLSSVAGSVTGTMKTAIALVTGKMPLVVGPGIKTGLDIRLDDPREIGADLVVGAVACLAMGNPPYIIIDMGTATTITVVDEKSRFLGGAIIPGLKVSMNALASGASALTDVALEAPKKVIGTNTINCMQSGAIYGSACMLDGMIDRMEEELGRKTTVVATGGLAPLVTSFCRHEIICDSELLLRGLMVIWEKNRRPGKA